MDTPRKLDYDEGFIVACSRDEALKECQAKHPDLLIVIVPINKNNEWIDYLVDLCNQIPTTNSATDPLIQKDTELYVCANACSSKYFRERYSNLAFKVLGCIEH